MFSRDVIKNAHKCRLVVSRKMRREAHMKKMACLAMAFMAALFCAGCAGRTEPGGSRKPEEISLYTSEAGSTVAQNSTAEDTSGEDLPGGGLPDADSSGGEKSEEFGDIPEKWKIPDPPLSVLTEEEMAQVDQAIRDYYSASYNLLGYERLSNRSIRGWFDEEVYSYDEVAGFRVSLEGVQPDRSIVLASKNGWIDCIVVNEGY